MGCLQRGTLCYGRKSCFAAAANWPETKSAALPRLSRYGKWSAKLDLKKVLLKPSPQLEFVFADGDG